MSKACGKSGHISSKKADIVKDWHWKTYGVEFSYECNFNLFSIQIIVLLDISLRIGLLMLLIFLALRMGLFIVIGLVNYLKHSISIYLKLATKHLLVFLLMALINITLMFFKNLSSIFTSCFHLVHLLHL